jgi:hypothetical protein
MRIAVPALVAVVIGVAAVAGSRTGQAPQPRSTGVADGRHPVLVELFTSEGCSSCPPADRLLADLLADQPIDGAEVVALSEHVDYWNRLGWRDPFSAGQFSDRQRAYAFGAFGTSQIYTPQAVIAGRYETIGSDRSKVFEAIRLAASEAQTVALTVSPVWQNGGLVATVQVATREPLRADADLIVAVAEDGLSSAVSAGENAGRRLAHAAVTRSLQSAASIARGRTESSVRVSVPLDNAWAKERLRLVCFVQERSARRILAVATHAVPPAVS